ncbi:MAG: cyclic nucleotide-binding/CBS domain-containing protein [Thermoplasmatota archaeon]
MKGLNQTKVLVKDIMTVNPIIIKRDESVKRAAELMKEGNVGSLLVLDKAGDLDGIVTEMDIVFKTVAEGMDPVDVKIVDIMSVPVHTIDPDKDIHDAAEIMADLGIRRLPVIIDDELLGIVTENDILEISPGLLDVTRELERINANEIEGYSEPSRREISGYCESCGVYSENLISVNGQLLCRECQ